jgi:hypothetical protein
MGILVEFSSFLGPCASKSSIDNKNKKIIKKWIKHFMLGVLKV